MDDIRKNGNILNDSLQHISTFAINEKRLMPSDSFIVATTATIGEYAFIQKKSY
jgi:type I restriction enzyme S subunit